MTNPVTILITAMLMMLTTIMLMMLTTTMLVMLGTIMLMTLTTGRTEGWRFSGSSSLRSCCRRNQQKGQIS